MLTYTTLMEVHSRQVQDRVKIRQPESAYALILRYSMYAVQNPCKNCEILLQSSKIKKNAEPPTTTKIWFTKWPKTQNFWFWHRPHETGAKQQSILGFFGHGNAVNISFWLRLRIGWYLWCLYIALRLGMFRPGVQQTLQISAWAAGCRIAQIPLSDCASICIYLLCQMVAAIASQNKRMQYWF